MIRIAGRRVRRTAVAAVGMSGLLLVTGCGTPQAGAAAVVGDQRISVASVQEATTQLLSVYGPDSGVSQPVILQNLMLAPYVLKAASDLGAGISADDARQQLRMVEQQSAGAATGVAKNIDPSAPTLLALRSNLTISQVQGGQFDAATVQAFYERLLSELAKDGVKVNPRYGVFNPKTLVIDATAPDWVAPTAPAEGGQPVPQAPQGEAPPAAPAP